MIVQHKSDSINTRAVKGEGLVNSIINKLPFELHLPGYQYCGPGTKLQKRLKRGDPGINPLDKACKEHDIQYSKHQNTSDRHIADKILTSKAWDRVKSTDANLGERANALLVTNIMKAKTMAGSGLKNKLKKTMVIMKRKKNKQNKQNHSQKRNSRPAFRTIIRNVKQKLKGKKTTNLNDSINTALKAAKDVVRKKDAASPPRVIPVPKVGGILPFLLPVFAGLSAIGSLSGGAAGIAKALQSANDAKKQLNESRRHNQTMESVAMGRGLYLQPYRKGLGLFLAPQTKNY